MKTINISDKAYRRMLEWKKKMEEDRQRLVSTSDVVDALLGIKEDDGGE